MKKWDTEVCAYSLESCRAAREGGATRVELCSGMAEGGTTPSAATIKLARRIPGLQLSVMIRPRGGDFLYSEEELEQMKQDIDFAKDCGADGVVLGVLTPEGKIDVDRTKAFVKRACPLKVTFHRAFDMVDDQSQALEDVIEAGCHRILTSGGRNTAVEGIETLKQITAQTRGRIQIMGGSGVNPENAAILADTGISALHFSGKVTRDSGMIFRNPSVSMGGTPSIGEYEIACTDVEFVKKIVEILNNKSV